MATYYNVSVRLEGYEKRDLQQLVGAFEYAITPWIFENLLVEPFDDVLLISGDIRMDSYEKPDDNVLDLAVSLWWGNNGFAPLEITIRPHTRGEDARTYIIGIEDFRKLRSQVAITSARQKGEQDK